MDSFIADVQGFDPGDKVELYTLDLTVIGYPTVIRWTPSRPDGGVLKFQGKTYQSRPIHFSGAKKSSQDKPAEPTLSVSNIDTGGYSLLAQYDELLGAKFTRLVTFTHYLDEDLDGTPNAGANGSAMFLPEIWYVEQREGSDPSLIQWRLKSPLDMRDKKLPARRAYRDICERRYRIWDPDTGTFLVSPVNPCPYAGSSYFKRDGTATVNPAEDECTQDLAGCALRFDDVLPGWMFPGLRRVG